MKSKSSSELAFSLLFVGVLLLSCAEAMAAKDAQPAAQPGNPAADSASLVALATEKDEATDLVNSITATALWNHLQNFQRIADENPGTEGHGNRDTGTSGYKASVDYVATLMRAAGYSVTIQEYRFRALEVVGEPQFATSQQKFALDRDWFVARLSAGGKISAAVQPAAGTGSGCAPSEFTKFKPGNVALLCRGSCSYDIQVANARAAGAVAVVLYNNAGEDGDKGEAFPMRLTRQVAIPVIGMVSHSVGAQLREQCDAGAAPTVQIDIKTRTVSSLDYNLIANSPLGDTDHVVVVDAHLDSIFGAGILDNASGSATILEIALRMANAPTRNQLRYIWFGGEELGLLGSKYYTDNLTTDERQRIAFDIDVDVTATPNFDYMIADPANASNVHEFPPNVVPESKVGNRFFADAFDALGVPSAPVSFGNDGTDSNSFSLIGIPNTGVLTRQNCCKNADEVAIWGGERGNYEGTISSFDGGCVDWPKRWCDNLDNNDPAVLEIATKATARTVVRLANYPFAPSAR